jgi:hypothetical protein
MPEHRIRLNRAWEIRAAPLELSAAELAAHGNSVADERFDLPLLVDDQPTDDEGRPVRLLLTRWFNAPSNLQPGQAVRVVVEPAAIVWQLQLNQIALPVEPAFGRCVTGETPVTLHFNLTGKLQRHNRLDILVGDPQCLSLASIALVIEEWQSD